MAEKAEKGAREENRTSDTGSHRYCSPSYQQYRLRTDQADCQNVRPSSSASAVKFHATARPLARRGTSTPRNHCVDQVLVDAEVVWTVDGESAVAKYGSVGSPRLSHRAGGSVECKYAPSGPPRLFLRAVGMAVDGSVHSVRARPTTGHTCHGQLHKHAMNRSDAGAMCDAVRLARVPRRNSGRNSHRDETCQNQFPNLLCRTAPAVQRRKYRRVPY